MLSEITSRELSEWMAFASIEPFGYMAGLHGAGIVAATVANSNLKKGKRPFKPAEFLPVERVKRSGAEFFAALKSIARPKNQPKKARNRPDDNPRKTGRKTRA